MYIVQCTPPHFLCGPEICTNLHSIVGNISLVRGPGLGESVSAAENGFEKVVQYYMQVCRRRRKKGYPGRKNCTNCTAGGGAAEGNGTASGGTDSEGWHPRWCLGDGLVLACRCCWHDWCLHGCCNRSCWCYSIQPAGMKSIHAELHYSSLCFIHATCCNLTLLRGVSFFSADSKTNKPASN